MTDPERGSKKKPKGIKKVGYYATSPVRYFNRKFKAGSLKGSIFTLITAILGLGTITLPGLSQRNGIVGGILLLLFGAIISWFAGMLLISCADKVGSDKYEDFAAAAYGKKMATFTAWCNIATLMGFVMAYVVAVKTLIPCVM